MDFQADYDSLTKTIDDTLSTQVSSSLTWVNIPGSLVKAVSSPAGYAWGFNSNKTVFVCQLPCTGNWRPVDLSSFNITDVKDIAVDYNNVYVLVQDNTSTFLLTNLASNRSSWTKITIPFEYATTIFSTNTYLWTQNSDGRVKYKCAKPCTTGNWINSSKDDILITSSNNGELYGINKEGNAVKTDENMNTPWSPIAGLAGSRWKSILGQLGKDNIYGIDAVSRLYNCGDSCDNVNDVKQIDTAGYTPSSLSADPQSKSLWMTSTSAGDKGNIFTRLDKPDYSSILNTVDPLDKQRDEIADEVRTDYVNQTKTLITNKQIQSVVDFFSEQFGYTKAAGEKAKDETSALTQNIEQTQQEIDKKNQIADKLVKLIITLVITAFVYLAGDFILGTYSHYIAIIVLFGGLIFTIYY